MQHAVASPVMGIDTRLKVAIAKQLRRLGLEVRSDSLRRGTLAGDLQTLLRRREVKTVLDVGANIGQFAQALRREIGFNGRIISFEPSPGAFDTLESFEDTNWDRYQLALGEDDETEAELFRYGSDQFDSFHRPSEWGRSNWDIEPIGSTIVSVRRLDAFATEHGIIAESTFLKIDAQGHDLDVLRGAGDFAKGCVGVLLEMPATNIYANAPSLDEIWQFVRSLGVEPVGLYPVQRWLSDDLLVLEFDGIFARPL